MQFQEAIPKDAATIILKRGDKFFLAQRNPQIKFLGGWHAFPGGKVEAEDAEVEVRNCADEELKSFIVAAVRETFEEVGVLLVRNGDKLTKGQRASLRDDLISERSTFAEILAHWGLWIDAADFTYTGTWTTPQFSPIRYKTRFFIADCPPRQQPEIFGEFIAGAFLTPFEALEKWENSEILITPPVLISLQQLAKNAPLEAAQKLSEVSEKLGTIIDSIQLNPRITLFPLRTKTLPPDTHTNCFVVGQKEFIVIDAASTEESEQAKLAAFVDSLIGRGGICKEIIVTHLHSDHHGGETALQKHLREKHAAEALISAHKLTAESLKGKVEIQRFIENYETFRLKDKDGNDFELQALHTPGHARGHLSFYDKSKGFLLSSDNVIGANSVIIAPPEGNLIDYLAALDLMKNLPNLRHLCGSHGAAIFDAKSKIESYIYHRFEREKQIVAAMENGAKTAREIVEKVYPNLQPELIRLAQKSVEAHLEKIEADKINNLPTPTDTEKLF